MRRWTVMAGCLAGCLGWPLGLSPALALGPLEREGDVVIARVQATGQQVYLCRATESGAPQWTFVEPKAALSQNGLPVGRHFAGPTWEYLDGSRIVGKVAQALPAPAPTDIPWLRLTVVSHVGQGALTPATGVLRVDTKGGVLASDCPTPNATREVPYTADYVFLR